MKLKEREDEITRLRHLIIEKDEIIDDYKRQLENGNNSDHRATSGEGKDDALDQSRSMSSDEDY